METNPNIKLFVILTLFGIFRRALSIDGTPDPDWKETGVSGNILVLYKSPAGIEDKDATFLCRSENGNFYSIGAVVRETDHYWCRYRNRGGGDSHSGRYDFLDKPDGAISWIPFGASLSPHAVRGGTFNLAGEPTFMPVCRAVLQNNLYVGTFDEEENVCRFMSIDKVDSSAPPEETEILVTNLYGRTI